MANPFTVAVPNVFEALMAGEQGYDKVSGVMKERAMSQARQQAAQEMQAGGNPQSAIARLIGIGDIQGATTIANMGNNQRDFAFRQQEANRAQGNTDRSFKFQEQQAADAARGLDYREIDDGNGGKKLVAINKATQQVTAPTISGVQTPPNNPFAYGKQNEAQSKDSGFANRMFRAEGVLRDPKVEGAATSAWENLKGMAPGFTANYITSPDFQKFDQAKRDFVNAVLRRESGAAISQSEFDNANKQYFPQPGESKEKIAEKRKNRQDAIAGVASGGGQTYRPPATFGPNGELVPLATPQPGTSPQPAKAASQVNEGQTATNPQTGQKIMFRGGQWVPAQ